jgi:hypothetical protein
MSQAKARYTASTAPETAHEDPAPPPRGAGVLRLLYRLQRSSNARDSTVVIVRQDGGPWIVEFSLAGRSTEARGGNLIAVIEECLDRAKFGHVQRAPEATDEAKPKAPPKARKRRT